MAVMVRYVDSVLGNKVGYEMDNETVWEMEKFG